MKKGNFLKHKLATKKPPQKTTAKIYIFHSTVNKKRSRDSISIPLLCCLQNFEINKGHISANSMQFSRPATSYGGLNLTFVNSYFHAFNCRWRPHHTTMIILFGRWVWKVNQLLLASWPRFPPKIAMFYGFLGSATPTHPANQSFNQHEKLCSSILAHNQAFHREAIHIFLRYSANKQTDKQGET